MEAGARLEVVSWDEGEEKPAKETGPRSETFSLNSVEFSIAPTRGRWQPKRFLWKHRISISVVSKKKQVNTNIYLSAFYSLSHLDGSACAQGDEGENG